MKIKLSLVLGLALLCLTQTACVVGRRTVPLTVPTAAIPSEKTGGPIHVDTIVDHRTFEQKPKDPSTPSIDGDLASMSLEQRSTMIGRQRNGYGGAMGDIALPAGDTVPKVAKRLLEEGLKKRGYEISADAAAPKTARVSVDEFWAWFTPGMFSVTFEARISCSIALSASDGRAEKMIIRGYGKNSGQVASDANWQAAYSRAFDDFLAQLDLKLNQLKF